MNFRSIREMQTISFQATGLKSSDENSNVDLSNIVDVAGKRILKTTAIYGQNAGGKSNVVEALFHLIRVMKGFNSGDNQIRSLFQPFRFQEDPASTDCFFQIVVIVDGELYRYGLTVGFGKVNGSEVGETADVVVKSEWLFSNLGKQNMTKAFSRELDSIETFHDSFNAAPKKVPNSYTTYLSHSAAFGDTILSFNLIRKFAHLALVPGLRHEELRKYTISYLKDKQVEFLQFLSLFNVDYDSIEIDEADVLQYPDQFPLDKITVKLKSPQGNQDWVSMNLGFNESAGNIKLFDIAAVILMAFNFDRPAFLVFDEIDSNFHPMLVRRLIEFFNDPNYNKSNSQLLFTTHDTNLLDPSLMRRDQFYFVEKNMDRASNLYCLSDLKGVRNDADFAKNYLLGLYGAIPKFIYDEA